MRFRAVQIVIGSKAGEKLAMWRGRAWMPLPFSAAFALMLVLAQTSNLVHTHHDSGDADGTVHPFGCEFCLQSGSGKDLITSSASGFNPQVIVPVSFEISVPPRLLATIRPNSRAPPSV